MELWELGGFLATAAKHPRINDMKREKRGKEIRNLNASLSHIQPVFKYEH